MRYLLIFLLFLTASCANKDIYHWGSYEKDLYKYYKTPAEKQKFAENLREIVDDAEIASVTVEVFFFFVKSIFVAMLSFYVINTK